MRFLLPYPSRLGPTSSGTPLRTRRLRLLGPARPLDSRNSPAEDASGSRFLPLAAALLAVVAGGAQALANDTVDLQIGGAAKIKGTIRDAAERERFVMDLPAGTTVRAKAKPKGRLAPVPVLDFVDSLGDPVATGTQRRRLASIAVPGVSGTGRFRLRLSGDGATDGDYQLDVTAAYRKKFTGGGNALAAAPVSFPFAAPAGSLVRIDVTPARGSMFVPSLEKVVGPSSFLQTLAGGGRATPFLVGPGGDFEVQLTNTGGDGDFTWRVIVTAPRLRPARIDITARALSGEFTYGQTVLGREIGSEGGILDPSAEGLPLGGTSLDVEPGALATPTLLTVAESTPFLVAAGINATGPAIRFGPAGTQFSIPATVTMPYDVGAYTDPATEMTIYILNELDGTVEAAEKPYDFSGPAGTVSFPTSHFSTFLTTNTLPKSVAGDWVWLRWRGSARAQFGGGVGLAIGDLYFDTLRSWFGFGYGPATEWGTDDGKGMPFVSYLGESLPSGGVWNAVSDDRVELVDGAQTPISFWRSESGDAMVEIVPSPAPAPDVVLSAMLRRTPGGATPTTTLGTWHFVRASARGSAGDPSNPTPQLSLEGTSIAGTVTFLASGRAVIDLAASSFEGETPYPTGQWTLRGGLDAPPAAWRAQGDVYLYFGTTHPPMEGRKDRSEHEGEVTSMRLVSALDGDVMVGVDDSGPDDDDALMILVRASTKANRSLVTGSYDLHDFETAFRDTGLPVAGFAFAARSENTAYAGDGNAAGTGRYGPFVTHDPQGVATQVYDSPDGADGPPPPFTYSVSPSGVYTDGRGVRGAVTRDGTAFFGLAGNRTSRIWRLVLGFRRPATKG